MITFGVALLPEFRIFCTAYIRIILRQSFFVCLGSQSLTKTDGAQEFDINLSYTIGGLGITVTDYWWNGITMPYGDYKHDHHFEGTLAYNFGENFPLTLSWSTMFAGGDDNKDGDRAYSTYINASYNIACPAEITLTPSVGFTPLERNV